MAIFAYAAYTPDGKHVDGQIEAATAAQAAELLHKKGLLSYRTQEVSAKASTSAVRLWNPKKAALSDRDYANFSRQLATLNSAGGRNSPAGFCGGRALVIRVDSCVRVGDGTLHPFAMPDFRCQSERSRVNRMNPDCCCHPWAM